MIDRGNARLNVTMFNPAGKQVLEASLTLARWQ
jgi:hypothetical protein